MQEIFAESAAPHTDQYPVDSHHLQPGPTSIQLRGFHPSVNSKVPKSFTAPSSKIPDSSAYRPVSDPSTPSSRHLLDSWHKTLSQRFLLSTLRHLPKRSCGDGWGHSSFPPTACHTDRRQAIWPVQVRGCFYLWATLRFLSVHYSRFSLLGIEAVHNSVYPSFDATPTWTLTTDASILEQTSRTHPSPLRWMMQAIGVRDPNLFKMVICAFLHLHRCAAHRNQRFEK